MKKLLGNLKIYGILLCGALIAALGLSLFLVPANLVSGGISGIGLIIHALTGFPVGFMMLILNIPLFIVGYRHMGAVFFRRSLFGAVMFSVLTDITASFPKLTDNLMLCTLFGGALLGIGIGIIFLFGATTGGTDILAQILHRGFSSIDLGKVMLILDALVIIASGILLGNWEKCLYGVIAATITGVLIDMMIQGANFAKVVYVISPKTKEIASKVMHSMNRGVTGISAKGMYTNKAMTMLMCVIKKHEITLLEKIVLSEDPNAFIIFTGARSVSGEGFKIYPIN